MSSEKYIPPYKVSGKTMNLIAEITAAIERTGSSSKVRMASGFARSTTFARFADRTR